MYTEATSKNSNDTSRLISPIYDSSNNTSDEFCFEFYYHMFGKHIGELRLYVRKVTSKDEWNLNVSDAVFLRAGEQGNQWRREFVKLGSIEDEFQVFNFKSYDLRCIQ